MIFKKKRLRDHFDTLSNYEGKLIRVAKGEVFYVKDGIATSLNYLSNGKLSNDINNPTIIDGKPMTWNDVKEVSSMPGSDTGNKLVELIGKIPSNVQTQLIQKGKTALGINENDPALLPMNASKKQAISVANGMSNSGYSQLSINPMTMTYIMGVAVVLIIVIMYMKK